MVHWEDVGQNIHMIAVRDGVGLDWSAYIYPFRWGGWELKIVGTNKLPLPIAGRTFNEIKEDAESWLKENGYEILEGEK